MFSTEENILTATSLDINDQQDEIDGGMSTHCTPSTSIWGED